MKFTEQYPNEIERNARRDEISKAIQDTLDEEGYDALENHSGPGVWFVDPTRPVEIKGTYSAPAPVTLAHAPSVSLSVPSSTVALALVVGICAVCTSVLYFI